MKIAVCAKYVPVVSRIQFDYEQKTIIREGVPSEVNPFDLLALVCGVELKSDDRDEVLVLTMGPPQAREGLVECLALGADRAQLLTDRALAGSDTLATARALALALEAEQPDLIICGRNSADAETGQVGPELAELLGIPHISQVSELEYQRDRNHIVARRVTDDGYQLIECPLPALVCVTEGIAPERFPDPEDLELAQEKPIVETSCAQLSSDPNLFGLAGSPTWVEDIRLVEPNRLGVVIAEEDPAVAAQQVAGHLRQRLAELAAAEGPAIGSADLTRYSGQREKSIWVVSESGRDGLRQVTLEMLGKARELSARTRSEVAAIVFGNASSDLVNQLASYGADRVLVLDNSSLGPVCCRGVVQSLAEAITAAQPYAVLFASTPDGRDLASRIAARLKLGLTGDAIDLEINDKDQLVQLKPALGGNVIAPILSKTLPNLVTLRPGLLSPIAPEEGAAAPIQTLTPVPCEGADITLLEEHQQEQADGVGLTQAQVVVGVGMGIGGEENLAQIQALVQSVGASLATTRNVVHSGWLPHQIQVGISGRTIAPQVYLAVGIRGAFNHTVGIQKAGVILAINRNHRAAIFTAADYGIVGGWEEYLPPLLEALRPVLAQVANTP